MKKVEANVSVLKGLVRKHEDVAYKTREELKIKSDELNVALNNVVSLEKEKEELIIKTEEQKHNIELNVKNIQQMKENIEKQKRESSENYFKTILKKFLKKESEKVLETSNFLKQYSPFNLQQKQ